MFFVSRLTSASLCARRVLTRSASVNSGLRLGAPGFDGAAPSYLPALGKRVSEWDALLPDTGEETAMLASSSTNDAHWGDLQAAVSLALRPPSSSSHSSSSHSPPSSKAAPPDVGGGRRRGWGLLPRDAAGGAASFLRSLVAATLGGAAPATSPKPEGGARSDAGPGGDARRAGVDDASPPASTHAAALSAPSPHRAAASAASTRTTVQLEDAAEFLHCEMEKLAQGARSSMDDAPPTPPTPPRAAEAAARPLPPLTPLASIAGVAVVLRTAQPHAAFSCGVASVRATLGGGRFSLEGLVSSAACAPTGTHAAAASRAAAFVDASTGLFPIVEGAPTQLALDIAAKAEAASGTPFVTLPAFARRRRAEGIVALQNGAALPLSHASADAPQLPPPPSPRAGRPLLLTRHSAVVAEVAVSEALLPEGGGDCDERDALEAAVFALGLALCHERFTGEGITPAEKAAGVEDGGRARARAEVAAGAAAAQARGWAAAVCVCERIAAQLGPPPAAAAGA